MNEEQFLNILSQMLLNSGYTKTREALFEEAKEHGFRITKKEIPLAKDLEIREHDAFFKISVMDSDIRAAKEVNGWIYIVLYLENQKIGAFDHQASHVMWQLVRNICYRSNVTGLKITDYTDLWICYCSGLSSRCCVLWKEAEGCHGCRELCRY